MTETAQGQFTKATKGEILSWAMYDFANSAYTTVVATAVFNPYFVKTIAGPTSGLGPGMGTLLLTVAICVSSILVVLTAPVIGTIADATARKKTMLLAMTCLCVVSTALLSQAGPGAYIFGMCVLIASNFAFGTGEDLVAAFLPEIATKEEMGRVSAFGWSIGYFGGLLSLGLCLAFVAWAQKQGQPVDAYVPATMLIVAVMYGLASAPTFLFLKERALPDPSIAGGGYLRAGFKRLGQTLEHARHFKDLFSFLATLLVFSCGTATVVGLASVYAQEVMGFSTKDSIVMLFVVNITAAIGAFFSGYIQDKIGSIKTLALSLILWIACTLGAVVCREVWIFWIIANGIGVAIGASGSASRALVGIFSPPGRSGEFFGLWGLAVKTAAAIGPICFGLVTFLTKNNCRIALLSTSVFFIVGLLMLKTVNEKRGKEAAQGPIEQIV